MLTSKNNLFAILVASICLLASNAAMAGGGTRPGSGSAHKPSKGTAPGVTNAINNANKFGVSSTTTIGNPGLSNSINNVNKFGSNNITTVYGSSNGLATGNGTSIFGGTLKNGPTLPCPVMPVCNNGHKPCWYEHCRRDYCYNMPMCMSYGFEPLNSSYVIAPGDTLESISMKEYGTIGNSTYIAMFNKLPANVVLAPGQTLMLPAISANKVLSPSHAPVATSLPVAMN
jgi:nucleoid-associated protein YgaU